MGFLKSLFGGNKAKPDYTGLQIQTAANALPIPIVYGWQSIAPNVLWYNGFQTRNQSGKGGLFNAGSSTGYTYYASLIMGLCEGPIGAVYRVWRDQSVSDMVTLGLTLFKGDTPQAVWPFLESSYPAQALAYQGTAYVCAPSYNLGDYAAVSNHNFEIGPGRLAGSGFSSYDCDPAQVISDFLTNPQYGVGFPEDSIDYSTLYGSSGDSSYQSYCYANAISISPALVSQETASSILARWLQLTNAAAVWSGGKLKFIPYGDTPVAAGTQITTTQTNQIAQSGMGLYTPNTSSSGIVVCQQSQFVSDGGVVYAATGKVMNRVSGTPGQGQYAINIPGIYEFANADKNTMVSITYTYQIPTGFTPNTEAVYSLTDDDYILTDGEDPLKVTISDPYKAYNLWTLNISDRENAYGATPIVARDQASIERFGLRMAPAVQATEICDAKVGAMCAELMKRRSVYIRQTFAWKSSWELCLLEPMDIVELTDSSLGLDAFPVRITSIEEDDDGLLTITAEEFPIGVGTAPLYSVTSGQAPTTNRNAPAPPVNAPILFEPTDALAGATEIWAAVSGSVPSEYGGCFVWYSTDGESFNQIGEAQGYSFQSLMGVLSAALPSIPANAGGSQTIDETNTLSVDLTESNGVLDGGSVKDMTSLATLAYVDGELVAYQSATLTGANKYDLKPMVRGVYDTPIADHATGTNFTRLNQSIIKLPYNSSQIGQQIFLKFQAFNAFGGGVQDIADVTAYSYTIKGNALLSPLPSISEVYTTFASYFEQIYWKEISDFRPFTYEIRKGTTWASGQFVASQAHPPFTAAGPGTYWISPRYTPNSSLAIYSDTPISIEITGNLLTQNITATDDEQTANWSGVKDTGISIVGSAPDTTLELDPSVAKSGYYTPVAIVDLGYVSQQSINITCLGAGIQAGQNILSVPDFLHYQDFLGAASSAYIDVHAEIALSQDGTTWSAWQRYVPGQYSCRAWKTRVYMASLDGATGAALLAFGWTASVPARIDHYLGLSVGTGGQTIMFQPDGASAPGPFKGGPNGANAPNYNISWQQQSGDYLSVSAISLSGMTFQIMNAGAPVARSNVNVAVEGY